jgi:hypothetical protein
MDGCTAHTSGVSTTKLEDLASKLHVKLYALPAHSSHITQPLDRCFFSSIKSRVAKKRRIIRDNELSARSHRVLDLLSCHYASNDPRVIEASFKRAGIVRVSTSSMNGFSHFHGTGLPHQIRDQIYCPVVIGVICFPFSFYFLLLLTFFFHFLVFSAF